MKVTVKFRPAEKADIPFLLSLRKQSMTEHLERAGLYLTDDQHIERIVEFFEDSHIILMNDQAIGLIKLGLNALSIHIRQFQIMPKHTGHGIGSYVLNVVKKKASSLMRDVTLNVLLENPALSLYKRNGFIVTGENKLEYQMCWQRQA